MASNGIRIVEPTEPHTHTIIFLHDRNGNSRKFVSELFDSEIPVGYRRQRRMLNLKGCFPSVRWVLPTAPLIFCEHDRMSFYQWFDMWTSSDVETRPDLHREGLGESIQRVLDIVAEQEKDVQRSRIFLGGVSQGFAAVLAAFLAEGRGGFAGLVGWCSWLPFASEVEERIVQHRQLSPSSLFTALQRVYRPDDGETVAAARAPLPGRMRATKVFLGHSVDDTVIAFDHGRRLREVLERLGLDVMWHPYKEGGHRIDEPRGLADMAGFIRLNMRITDP